VVAPADVAPRRTVQAASAKRMVSLLTPAPPYFVTLTVTLVGADVV
jgi:hypothetical protein